MLFIMIFGTLLTVAVAVILFQISRQQTDRTRKVLMACAAMLAFSVGMELFLFNVGFYTSFKNKPIPLTGTLAGKKNADGTYTIDSSERTLVFSGLDTEIKNLHIELAGNTSLTVPVNIYLSDEGSVDEYETPQRTLCGGVAKSQYINIHSYGKTQNITVSFDLSSGEKVELNGITANAKRPFSFSLFRVVIVFALLCFCYLFAPSSDLYKIECTDHDDLRKTLAASFLCLQGTIIVILAIINPIFLGFASKNCNTYAWSGNGVNLIPIPIEAHNEYDDLAKALLNGKVNIDTGNVPRSLQEMQNPYDTMARMQNAADTGDTYRWDVAYYQGHYYVYFGIVPELLMYLPFRALTGSPFPTAVGIMVFAILFSVGLYKLLYKLIQKYFPRTSVGTFMLLLLTFVNSCGLMFLVKRPDFYSIPVITGMTFTVWGLYLWLCGLDKGQNKRWFYLFGSLLMALVAGCRPQLLLLSILALPLFFGDFFKRKELLQKKGLCEFALLLLPYAVVAAGLMYYNKIRFGSPFDFGSAYNLTTNDVTNRGFNIARLGTGFFTYLFQLPTFTAVFPFLQKETLATNYVGKTIFEYCFGGLFASLPILWSVFGLGRVRKTLHRKKLLLFTVLLLLLGLILVAVDTESGGILQRYYSDFGFVFFLAATLIIFSFSEPKGPRSTVSLLRTFVFLGSILSIFYSVLLVFSVSDVTIDTQNPVLFQYLAQTVQFWL